MITGTVDVTWQPNDYMELEFEQRYGNTYNHTGFYNHTNMPNNSDFLNIEVCSTGLPYNLLTIAEKFNFDKFVVAVNKLTPGSVLPFHSDTYKKFRKNFSVDLDTDLYRIIIFLHDPAAGHQLWIEDHMCNGIAGTYFGWVNQTEHMAANLGKVDRYTLQITGTKKI